MPRPPRRRRPYSTSCRRGGARRRWRAAAAALAAAGLAVAPNGAGAQVAAPVGPGRAGAPAVVPPSGAAEVRGRVVDVSGAPVGGAGVAVRAGRTAAVVAGALADPDGRFRVRGLAPGAYTLRVSRLGYAPRTRPFAVDAPDARVDVDTVSLARVALSLTEVRVVGEAHATAIAPDRSNYRTKDVAPGAASASEVLEVVPSVEVDADGKVSLRGNDNVVVQINGRPTPLRGPQLAAFLKQIPGPVVERVEVVPNPSAKYDPEGMAGIINIVLKQEADLGVSGGYTLSAMNRDRWNGAGNVGYGRGGLSLASSVGYLADDRRFVGAIDRERYDVARALTGTTLQDVGGTTGNRGVNVTANADWKVGPRDVLSEAVVVNVRTGGEDSRIAWTDLGATGAPLGRFLRPRVTTTRGVLVDATTAWKRTLAPRRHELAAELRANRTDDADRTLFTRRSFDGATLLDGERNDADAAATQLTAQLDYTRPVGKAVRLETGYRGNSRWLDRDLRAALDPTGDGRWAPSPLSNAFRFGEHVQAGYAVVTRTARGVDLQGGLRTEYTARTFAIGGARNPFRYVSLFPSASLSYGAAGPTQARVSFARRIRRPGESELNPFPRFLDVQNAFIGNPALRPEYTDAVEASFARTGRLGTVQVAPFVRRTTDIIRVDVDPDAVVQGRNVTTVSFVNLATSRSFGADLSGTLKAGTRFTGLGAFNVYRLVTSGGSATSLGVDAVAWSARLNATLRLTDGLSAQATYFYRAPYGIERNRWEAFQTTTLLLRQKVRGERGAVTLRALDPFNTNRWAIRGGTASLVQFTERTPGVRGVFVGYQYTVGQAPRLRQPRQDPQAAAPAGGFAPP